MDFRKHLSTLTARALERLGVQTGSSLTFEHPAEPSHGDYSTNVALQHFSTSSGFTHPRAFAQALVVELVKQIDGDMVVSRLEVAGPGFINFWLSPTALVDELQLGIDQGEQYGSSDWGKGQRWLIEHTSPNPNKAMHLGHLRNNITGMAIARLWEKVGVEVIRDCIDNNRGIAIAKLMWGYLKFAHKGTQDIESIEYWFDHQDEWNTPEDLGMRPDRFVDELYVKASEDFKDPEVEQKVRQLVVDWENRENKNWALWEKVLLYSYAGQELTLKRLGNQYDKVWHEHEHYQEGKDLVEKGLKSGIFVRAENGAIVTSLEKYGIPDTIVRKADGTSLYITQDLALTRLKKETFHPDRMFWTIGPEQSLAMQQVFAVCEQLGIGKKEEFTHIAFGYMSIKGQGKMSSRAGNVVYIDELIDLAKTEVLAVMDTERMSSEADREEVAEQVALGAVKYSILKVGRITNTAFDFATSLSLDGDSGPYLQYTYARCTSVLEKSGITKPELTRLPEFNEEELALLRWMYRYPEVVLSAAQNLEPSVIATFIMSLAQRYNQFYHQHQILGSEVVPDQKASRLLLTLATKKILYNGLQLLGIKAPERM